VRLGYRTLGWLFAPTTLGSIVANQRLNRTQRRLGVLSVASYRRRLAANRWPDGAGDLPTLANEEASST
jgi:hypothetical protein